MRFSPPSKQTFLLSLLVLLFGIGMHAAGVPLLGSYWLPVFAYIILAFGVLVEGY